MKKIGVILSGCGVYDGSEIHEAVLTLLAISRSGAQAVCFAPDKQQVDVINHLTGEAMTETRNVLIEAARITRGEIRPLAQADAAELDAILLSEDQIGCVDCAGGVWRGEEFKQFCQSW